MIVVGMMVSAIMRRKMSHELPGVMMPVLRPQPVQAMPQERNRAIDGEN
jgi:hypothetical protein